MRAQEGHEGYPDCFLTISLHQRQRDCSRHTREYTMENTHMTTWAAVTTGVLLGVFFLPPGGVVTAAVVEYPSSNEMPMAMTACTCPTYHPQTHICQIADVVFRAVIMWKEPTESKGKSGLSGSTLTYSMLTDKVYKRHPKVRKGREVLVKTADSSAMCGMTGLNVNEEYLITGNIINGELFISLCNFIRPWNHMSAMQKSAFKNEYKDSCEMCYIAQEHNRKIRSINDSTEEEESIYYIEPDNSTLMCTHSPRHSSLLEMEDCETEYSTCLLHRPGSCKWHMSRKYSKCLAKRERKTKLMMAKYGPSMFGPQPLKLKGSANKASKSTKKQKSKKGKKKFHG